MPELFKMDNFDDCADTFSPIPFPKQYCIISIRLHNQDNKNLAKLVKTQNRKLNFNHEILKYGICASSCLRVHHHLKNDYAKYLTETTSLRETPRDEGKILMMNKLANVCINKELMDVYGLKAETHVDYCVQADFPYYRLDGFFVLAILVLIVLFVIGGFYEKYKNRPKFKSFLEKWKRIRSFLQSYSLRGNWNKFWDVDKNENELLTIFGGFKITLMFFFIYSQVYKQITALPFANPVYIERVSLSCHISHPSIFFPLPLEHRKALFPHFQRRIAVECLPNPLRHRHHLDSRTLHQINATSLLSSHFSRL